MADIERCLEALDHVEAAYAIIEHWGPAQSHLHLARCEIEHHLGELTMLRERKRWREMGPELRESIPVLPDYQKEDE